MVERRKIAVVGAGPAGLSVARSLLSQAVFDVVIFERGRTPSNRICPVDIGMNCSGCKGTCNVISGFGGSAHYGDAVKISLLPAGRRLIDLFGDDYSHDLMMRALNFFQLDDQNAVIPNSLASNVFSDTPFELREYPVISVHEDHLRRLIEQYLFHVQNRSRLLLRSPVTAISRDRRQFQVEFTSAGTRRIERFDDVVLAPGRAGFADLNRFSRELGVETLRPNISIGIRLELPNHLLLPFTSIHADLKIRSENFFGHKVKTFCFCSGPTGGRVKFCNYRDQFDRDITLLDGHINVHSTVGSSQVTGNMAFLAQLDTNLSNSSWVRDNVVEPYGKLANGKPLWQPFAEFYNYFHADRIAELGDGFGPPSVPAFNRGRIDKMIPQSVGASLSAAVAAFLKIVSRVNQKHIAEILTSANILYPEIEFFWNTIQVTPGMVTNIDNLYVIGDGAGLAQGNLQAAMTGFAAADNIKLLNCSRPAKERFSAASF